MNFNCPLSMLPGTKVTVKDPRIVKRTPYGSIIEYTEKLCTVEYALFTRGKLVYFTVLECTAQSFNPSLLISIKP